jgi:serine/threonine protein kinase
MRVIAMIPSALHIKTVFGQALDIEAPSDRAAFLDAVCQGNAALRADVEEMLRAHEEAGRFLDPDGVLPLTAAEQVVCLEQPGTVIGPYKLLEQIGEGGMGLVFMAEQTRPVRRRIAFKVLKPGMETRQVVARFEAERQALALMDHPHIAKVFDAGVSEAGRPYFVMELVRGVPITEYCDERRLSTRQRLELFATVCQAVQHAHQKGVIHRDLKPSNVLVTQHDTVAVPKIIDFGIAKATAQPLTERTLITNFAQMLGTPLYMSPEQAEMNSLDVDTRSDVYSLGVLLYELLTGTTPFESETLKQVGLDEIRRKIREEEPPTPSRRVSTLAAQDCSTISERRGVDGRRHGQVLRGELDWIVMKALEKDRNHRYESASAFAADVQCYLNDQTVEACPPSAAFRLRKYVRRNRRLLATAGIVAAALIAATAVSTWQAFQAREAQRQAEADRDRAAAAQQESEAAETRATNEAAIARAVKEFLQQDLLRQVDSDPEFQDEVAGNANLTVKEALNRAAAKIGERFPNQPLVEAAIRTAIGDAYRSIAQNLLSIPHFERALALHRAHLGQDHPETLASIERLSNRYLWAARYSECISLRQEILQNRLTHLGPDHPDTLACTRNLATAFSEGRQWDKSLPIHERVLEKQRLICGPNHPNTLDTLQSLAMTYDRAGRFSESVALYEQLLSALRARNGPEHESATGPMLRLAQVYQRAGRLDRSDQLLREVLEQYAKRKSTSLTRRHRATALSCLGLNLLLKEQYTEAEPLVREALAVYDKELPGNPYRFIRVSLLGAILLGQQRFAQAEPLLLQGYDGLKKGELTSHLEKVWVTDAGQRVIRFYEVTNQPEKAREWRERLLEDKNKK